MHYYRVFGRLLASQLEAVELAPARAGRPDISFSISNEPAPSAPLPRLGSERVQDDVRVVLRGAGARYRLEYDDTGVFEIERGGTAIVWYRPADHPVDDCDVRTDLFGRVLAVALHAAGVPTLHASGVALGGTAAVFVGPKLLGKSTLAAALQRAGGRVLGDDAIAVLLATPPLVMPGIPSVQVWRDTAEWLAASPEGMDAHGKLRVAGPARTADADTAVPVGAVYVLAPLRADEPGEVSRERLPHMGATLALLGQAKIGPLLGHAEASPLLDQLARLAESVPVYRLSYRRDFGQLDDLVARMAEWHDAPLSAGSPVV
jgi:hypothetical protein